MAELKLSPKNNQRESGLLKLAGPFLSSCLFLDAPPLPGKMDGGRPRLGAGAGGPSLLSFTAVSFPGFFPLCSDLEGLEPTQQANQPLEARCPCRCRGDSLAGRKGSPAARQQPSLLQVWTMIPSPSKSLVWNCAAFSKVEGFGTENWPASGCTRNGCRGPPSRSHTAVAVTEGRPLSGCGSSWPIGLSNKFPEYIKVSFAGVCGGEDRRSVAQKGSARSQGCSPVRVGGQENRVASGTARRSRI